MAKITIHRINYTAINYRLNTLLLNDERETNKTDMSVREMRMNRNFKLRINAAVASNALSFFCLRFFSLLLLLYYAYYLLGIRWCFPVRWGVRLTHTSHTPNHIRVTTMKRTTIATCNTHNSTNSRHGILPHAKVQHQLHNNQFSDYIRIYTAQSTHAFSLQYET